MQWLYKYTAHMGAMHTCQGPGSGPKYTSCHISAENVLGESALFGECMKLAFIM